MKTLGPSFKYQVRFARSAFFWTLLSILFGLLLLVGPSFAEKGGPTTGVTIIVHGLVPADGLGRQPLQYWGAENIAGLLERFRSGRVWLYDPDTGGYDNITDQIPNQGVTWTNSASGEQILLFNWTRASDEAESGQAEAAADALFASLVEFRIGGVRLLTPGACTTTRPLHFIGHSRGTVVVSETIQRLGQYNIPVSYVTYLDPHDYGQPFIARDHLFHDPAVQVWDNVGYAENYFQLGPPLSLGCINPGGRRLAHIPSWPVREQIDLTSFERFDQCDGLDSPHSRVKDFYWGTVLLDAHTNSSRPSSWYGGGSGAGYGFDRWLANGGYDQGTDPLLNRANSKTLEGLVPFYWAQDLSEDNGFPDDNGVPPVLFNGNFQLPDLDLGIGGTQANSMAGWFYFGGGGNAFVRSLFGDSNVFIELLDNSLEARHNRFYMPATATALQFDWRVAFVPLLGTHSLEVLLGETVIADLDITESTSDFQRRTVTVPSSLRDRVNTLTFRLKTNRPLNTPVVLLDNIRIVADIRVEEPELICPQPVVVECESCAGTEVELVASVRNSGQSPMRVVWRVNSTVVKEEVLPVTSGSQNSVLRQVFPWSPDAHVVTVQVFDACGSTSCETTVTVVDTTPPRVNVGFLVNELWPPNNTLRDVGFALHLDDDCDPKPAVMLQVFSDEPNAAPPPSPHNPDVIFDPVFKLRAERQGSRKGRVYLVVASARDQAGNVSRSCAAVTVPHDISKRSRTLVFERASGAVAACMNGELPAGYFWIGERFLQVEGDPRGFTHLGTPAARPSPQPIDNQLKKMKPVPGRQ